MLTWFIEDGAGVDYIFKLQSNPLTEDNYCDVQRLIDLLQSISVSEAAPAVNLLYGPLHLLIAKNRSAKQSDLAKRLLTLEISFANILEQSKSWLNAFKSYARIGDMLKVSKVLSSWAADVT